MSYIVYKSTVILPSVKLQSVNMKNIPIDILILIERGISDNFMWKCTLQWKDNNIPTSKFHLKVFRPHNYQWSWYLSQIACQQIHNDQILPFLSHKSTRASILSFILWDIKSDFAVRATDFSTFRREVCIPL